MVRPSSLIVVALFCIVVAFCRGENTHVRIASVPDWVVTRPPVEYEAPAPEKDRSGAYHLLIDRQTHVEKQAVYSHSAYRITSSAGLQRASQFSLSFDPDFEWIDLHELKIWREGKSENRLVLEKMQIFQQERQLDRYQYNGQLTALLILEDVRVGDVIEYAFTRRGQNPIFGKHHGEFEITNRAAPIRRQTVRLITDAAHPISCVQLGGSPLTHSLSEEGPLIIHEWNATNQPAAQFEEGTPRWHLPFSVLQVSDFATWQDVVTWALPLYAPKPISEALREKVKEITSGLRTDRDRTIAILDFVQRDVRYLGVELGSHSHAPNEPDKVFQMRYGDCKDKVQLFCAMLNEIGISSVPALVQSSMGKAIHEWLPGIVAFDHVIAKVKVDGLNYWVDPTLTDQAGTIEHRALPGYKWALPIEPATIALQAIAPPAVGKESFSISTKLVQPSSSLNRIEPVKRATLSFDEPDSVSSATIGGGSEIYTRETFITGKPGELAELEVVATYGGSAADAMRAYLRETPTDLVGKNALNFRTKSQPGIKLTVDPTWDDNRRLNEISVTYRYHVPELWQKTEGSPVLRAEFYPASFREFLAAPETTVRSSPYGLPHPLHVVFQTTIRLDHPWPIKSQLESYKDEAFTGHFSAEAVGKSIILRYEYTTLTDAVEARRMGEFTTHLRGFRDVLGYSLTFNPEIAKRNATYRLNWTLIGLTVLSLGVSIALAFWVYQRPWGLHSRRLVTPNPELVGLGGWLIPVGFGVFARPVLTTYAVLHDEIKFLDARVWESLGSHARIVIFCEHAGQLMLLTLMSFCALTFVRRRRIFPIVFIVYVIATLAFHIVDWVIASRLPGWTDSQSAHLAGAVAQLVLAACIWIPYMFVSQRVKATFTRERARSRPPVQPPPLTVSI